MFGSFAWKMTSETILMIHWSIYQETASAIQETVVHKKKSDIKRETTDWGIKREEKFHVTKASWYKQSQETTEAQRLPNYWDQ